MKNLIFDRKLIVRSVLCYVGTAIATCAFSADTPTKIACLKEKDDELKIIEITLKEKISDERRKTLEERRSALIAKKSSCV
jgi:hypothetical protein